MSIRTARLGSWKKEKSMCTENRIYKDYIYKEHISKENKPIDSWDDIFINPQRSWKKHRKHQYKIH